MTLLTVFLQEAVPADGSSYSFLLLFMLLFVLPGIGLIVWAMLRKRKKD